jgi:transposase
MPPEWRRQRRQLQSNPIAEALAAWAESTVRQLSRKSELARAFRYVERQPTVVEAAYQCGPARPHMFEFTRQRQPPPSK